MFKNIQIATFIILFSSMIISKANSQELTLVDTTGFANTLKQVMKNHPRLKIKEEIINQQKEDVVQSKFNFLSNFTIGFQFYQSPPVYGEDGTGILPHFGFTIGLNFQSLLVTPSRIRQSKAKLKVAEEEYLEEQFALKRELFERYSSFKKSVQHYQIIVEKFRAIDNLFDMSQQKFENGEIGYQDYAMSIKERAEVKQELLEAEFQLKTNKARFLELIEE